MYIAVLQKRRHVMHSEWSAAPGVMPAKAQHVLPCTQRAVLLVATLLLDSIGFLELALATSSVPAYAV